MIPGIIASMQPAVGGGGPVVYDTFTDTGYPNISAHTPDTAPGGSSWGGYTPATYVVSDSAGHFLNTGAIKNNGPIIDSGLSDCVITLFVKAVTLTNHQGIVFRNTATTDVLPSWGVRALSASFILREGTTLRASQSGTFGAGNENMVVTLNGTSIQATFMGATLNYTSATNQTVTTHGPKPGVNGVDNFTVEAL